MTELLAPAGSYDSLRGAVNAGCDAVYIGGTKFGARAYADNPDTELMKRCLDFCHIRDKKLYLTVNTLLKENELEKELLDYLIPLYEIGLDAVIVQDPGVMDLVSRELPGLDIHASTQCTITTARGIEYLKSLYPSITRVVPARELSMDELKSFRQETGLELEVFVHGALCYCYSGQCLFSSYIGGRSGNRGRCAQPCRKLYNDRYLLSMKDICTLGDIPALMEMGIDSFKIEGRMKSPEYTAGVVAEYRRIMDACSSKGSVSPADLIKSSKTILDLGEQRLKELYNRGGFCSGYLHDHNSPSMMSFDRPNHTGVQVGEVIRVRAREAVISLCRDISHGDVLEIRDTAGKRVYEYTAGSDAHRQDIISTLTMRANDALKGYGVFRTKNAALIAEIDKAYLETDSRVPVVLKCTAREGLPVVVQYECQLDSSQGIRHSVTLPGMTVEKASNAPATCEGLVRQLSKTGDTEFYVCSSSVDMDNDVFVPVGELNRLRRTALDILRESILTAFRREIKDTGSDHDMQFDESADILPGYESPSLTVSVEQSAQLEPVLSYDIVGRVIFNPDSFDSRLIDRAADMCIAAHKELTIGLPYICRYDIRERIVSLIDNYKDRCSFLVRNWEELELARNAGARIFTDRSLYKMNRRASSAYGDAYMTLPTELNRDELSAVAGSRDEMIVYGYQPVMVSAQCTYKNTYGRCRNASDNSEQTVFLKDELGHSFRTRQMCAFCQNIIYNNACLDLTDSLEEIGSLGVGSIRIEFTSEDNETIDSVLNAIKNGTGCEHVKGLAFTAGHFRRGVE